MDTMNIQKNLIKARRENMLIIEPRPNQIQIDLDGARALHRYGFQFMLLREYGITRGWKERMTPSKTPGHTHITITMPRAKPPIERVCLAAILGSDLKREAFDYCRVTRGNKYPIAFFEKVKKRLATTRNK
jgi:hypothetical protein